MPSLITGYEYDVFISYRTNDNKPTRGPGGVVAPGWVTEFAEALKQELAATVKHPVSVYIDTDPEQGLHESHDVDKSLEGKLRCLIFIPVFSQTYCDPNSFAWKHEFVAFNHLASADKLGRDVKLINGNVASRILPIKIHEVDDEDRKIIEAELKSVARPIDFTFRSAGVNRPLTPMDDDVRGDQGRLVYRNQINKTANAIKDLLASMKTGAHSTVSAPTDPGVTIKPRTKKVLAMASTVLAVLVVAAYLLFYFRDPQSTEGYSSIAVLPFVDMSPDKDQAYLGDGLAEAVINSLATMKDLKVIGRTSSFQFKDEKVDLRKIGELLGARVILEGSVQKIKDKIRITAQLIDVEDNAHLWSQQYDRNLDDIFKIQDDISGHIIESLKGTLLGGGAISRGTNNVLAYETYLKGSYELSTYSIRGMHRADELFNECIRLDSNYADAYAGLADATMYRAAAFISELSGLEATTLAQPLLEKSVRLNPELSGSHLSLGFIQLYAHWNSEAAEKEYLTALRYSPHNAEYISIYIDLLNFQRRHEEALKYSTLQYEIEPFYPNARMPVALFYLGREKEALDFQRERLTLLNSYSNHDVFGFLNLNTGKYAEAIASFNEATRILGKRVPRMVAWTGAAYAKSGDMVQANKLLSELKVLANEGNAGSPNFFMAVLQTALGDNEAALTSLERAVDVHDWELPWIITEPQLYPLHRDPRFVKIAKAVGFKNFGDE